jgi:hypothetical protein
MDKDRILNAANAIQGGADAGDYYDELEMIIGLIMKASDEDIAAVWREIHEDAQETADTPKTE